MYEQLLVAVLAAISLILLARRFPILAVILYSLALLYFVGFSRSAKYGGVSIRFPLPILRAILTRHYGLATNRSILNLVLFIPFGYLLPEILVKDRKKPLGWKPKWWLTVGCGLCISFLIELSQLLFRFGVFELDDLVKNTMGAAVGWWIWRGLNKSSMRCSEESVHSDG